MRVSTSGSGRGPSVAISRRRGSFGRPGWAFQAGIAASSGRRVGRSIWTLLCSILLALLVLTGSAVLPAPRPVQAETLLGSAINVATTPNQTAANPTTNRIYVTNGGAGTVTVIDGITNQVIGTPILMGTSGSGAVGVAVDHTTNRIYVTCFNDDKVRVIDGAGNGNGGAGTLVAGDITVGDGPWGIAVDTVSHRAFVTNYLAGTVSTIQGSTDGTGGPGAVVGPLFNPGPTSFPRAVAVNPTTHKAYVASAGLDSVSVIQGSPTSGAAPAGFFVGTSILVGDGPIAVAVNATTNRVYVGNFEDDTVTVIDGAGSGNSGAGDVVSTITVGAGTGQPSGVAVNPNGNRVYVTNEGPNTVSVIDGSTNTVQGADITVGNDPTGIGVNLTTGFVYVANTGATTVSVLGRPFLQEGVIGNPISVGPFPIGITVNPTTNRVYVTDQFDDTVSVIDGGDTSPNPAGEVVGTAIGVGSAPRGVAINPTTNRIYVANTDDATVSVIDGGDTSPNPAGEGVGTAIAVGDDPRGVAVNPTTNRIYVSNRSGDTVSVIDGGDTSPNPAGEVVGTAIGVGDDPRGVAVNPTTNRVYVTNYGSDTVSVIDGGDTSPNPAGEGVGTAIAGGNHPQAVAVNPTTNRVYVANRDDTVSVIDGGDTSPNPAGEVVGTAIGVGGAPAGVAVNPTTNRVYVANQSSSTVSVIDGGATQSNPAGAVLGLAIPVGNQAQGVAVNPRTGRVYVTNSTDSRVMVLGPTFNASATRHVPGADSTVQVTWDKLFGTKGGDFVGVFAAVSTTNDFPIIRRFTNNTLSPTGVGLGAGTVSLLFPANMAIGDYQIRLVSGHNNETLASLGFRVAATPVATNDAYAVNNGSTLTVPVATGLLANDTDADTTKVYMTTQVVTTPTKGTLALSGNGSFTYTPLPSTTGVDTFTYRVTDPDGLVSNTATVTITVSAVTCGPRPSVTVGTSVSGGVLTATITANNTNAPNNRLVRLDFGTFQNAVVSRNGNPITSGQSVTLPANTTTTTIIVDRASPGLPPAPTHVPFTVVDNCGSWPTFVGGGSAAGF